MERRLEIDITPAGTPTINVIGCTGDECIKASEPIEVVLGGVSERKDKPERFMAPTTTANAIKQQF